MEKIAQWVKECQNELTQSSQPAFKLNFNDWNVANGTLLRNREFEL